MNSAFITSYERDNETNLDYACARYYSSQNGRFITVDPLMASAVITVAQSWNRYSYALNNPLKYTDPTGELPESFTAEQNRLFNTYAENYNKTNKTNLTADEIYNGLNESQQTTFIAATHALENSFVTSKDGKSKVSAISLVSGITQITGEQKGKKGTEQFRLLVTLTDDAVGKLRGSKEFKEGSTLGFGKGHIYKDGVVKDGVENVRQKGGKAKLQVSYDQKNLLEADIDVDYRNTPSIFGDSEGHLKTYNSDVRAVGPEKSGGKPINNLERHNATYGRTNPLRNVPTITQ